MSACGTCVLTWALGEKGVPCWEKFTQAPVEKVGNAPGKSEAETRMWDMVRGSSAELAQRRWIGIIANPGLEVANTLPSCYLVHPNHPTTQRIPLIWRKNSVGRWSKRWSSRFPKGTKYKLPETVPQSNDRFNGFQWWDDSIKNLLDNGDMRFWSGAKCPETSPKKGVAKRVRGIPSVNIKGNFREVS